MSIHQPREQGVRAPSHTLAWLETGIDLRYRSDGDNPSRGHGDGVIDENGVDRRDR